MPQTRFLPRDSINWEEVSILLANDPKALRVNCFGAEEQQQQTPRVSKVIRAAMNSCAWTP